MARRASTNASRKPSPEQRAERARAELAELKKTLDAQVLTLTEPGSWRAMVRAAAGMRRYSVRNLLLILAQCPHAAHVAGFREWQQRGRQVRKGEKSIRILAPMTIGATKGTSAETGKEATRDTDPNDEDARPLVLFRPIGVFDISQTDPIKDTPAVPPTPQITGPAPGGLWGALSAYTQRNGFTLERGKTAPARAWTDFRTRTVRVSGTAEDADDTRALAHEAGHIACNHGDDIDAYATHRGAFETEAESVAHIVAAVHGLDTSLASAHYVAGWATRENPDDVAAVLRESAERVIRIARAVLDDLHTHATQTTEHTA